MTDLAREPVGHSGPTLDLALDALVARRADRDQRDYGIGLRAAGRCAPLSPLGIELLRLYLAAIDGRQA